MQDSLKKRLALLKARAREIRESYGGRAVAQGAVSAPMALIDATPGEERVIGAERFHWIRLAGDAIADDATAVAARYLRICQRETWPLPSIVRDPGPEMARRIANDEVCFFDIETTGLMPNTYLFLCGLMYVEGGEFIVEQLFARDYDEEAGVLCHLRDMMERFPMFVTYNGANFDMPFVNTRMAVMRIQSPKVSDHVDLVDVARNAFSEVLPNCKLETIERHLRGFGRTGDIPGREIPEAYHNFVRSGDARQIKQILYHNRMDLLAMAYLVNHLAEEGISNN